MNILFFLIVGFCFSKILHLCRNSCHGMLFILSGEIRTDLLSEEGREVTLFRLYPGEPCVLSASCVISQMLNL